MQAMHVSPFGGTWYPGGCEELERLLEDLFARSVERTGPFLRDGALGFVVPHAGVEYSGCVAAAAYRHLQRHPAQRAVVLGFAHRGGPAGVAIPDVDGYATPLGEVRTDREAMARLAARQPFREVPEQRICDHSVEIQLPLLQWAAPQMQVVPLFVGHLDGPARDAAAEALAGLCGPGTVFLVSSDLTHFGRAFGYQPFAVDSAVSARLEELDRGVMEAAASLDAEMFLAAIRESSATVCGVAPISLWLRTLETAGGEEVFQQTLDYQTSGEITGDYDHTVSYGALGYFRAPSFCLDAQARALLLESAQATLAHLRATNDPKAVPQSATPESLAQRLGVFVGLHQGKRLLGCVGNPTGRESLAVSVPEMTLRAALEDPRFPTVLGVEGPIEIEISVLSPAKPVRNASRFRIGEHGACLDLGSRRGLLLPQVAAGREWTREQFLGALSMKAGMGSQGYKNPRARLSVFRAQVFATGE